MPLSLSRPNPLLNHVHHLHNIVKPSSHPATSLPISASILHSPPGSPLKTAAPSQHLLLGLIEATSFSPTKLTIPSLALATTSPSTWATTFNPARADGAVLGAVNGKTPSSESSHLFRNLCAEGSPNGYG
ncbi:hypothetical protein K443DRAFT_9857 [Laccaria amethystina LaAM-08-1]|uniref:Uncharacterized protein n=1 Tax=Laccaria amethystina LaAM-08-1 TaxID=1095629 RepID=A0A0C9XNF0_9AGAR|nr:hypothetical protein K443DRAFT_9857 [Laccaria amethystina LaAM-08-1]